MTHYSETCHVCDDQSFNPEYVDPETGSVGWCEECRCGTPPRARNTLTNFSALREAMCLINEHKCFLASDAPVGHKEICADMFLEWNKSLDDLTTFEWNIVKAHLPRY